MGDFKPVTYHHVTPEVFKCMKNKLIDMGIHGSDSNSGHISGHGVEADFSWDGKSDLTITITDKPAFISCGIIIGNIHDIVHECHGI